MEKFILADAVLQATHMKKFQRPSMHIKKYQGVYFKSNSHQTNSVSTSLNTNRSSLTSRPIKTHNLQKKTQKLHQTDKQNLIQAKFDKIEQDYDNKNKSFSNQNNFAKHITLRRKNLINTKTILQDNQKNQFYKTISVQNRQLGSLNQYFVKKQIQPKSRTSRQSPKTATCARRKKYHESTFFYDFNLDFVKQRQQKCIILPQKVPTVDKQDSKSVQQKLKIQDFVKKQIQDQQRKRKVQCKTASSLVRHKASVLKQTKRIQEQIRLKQFDSIAPTKNTTQSYKPTTGLSIYKNIMPLSKQQIKIQSRFIMDKYNVDVGKYFYKIHGQ